MATFKTTSKVQRDAKGGKFTLPVKFPKLTAWSFSLYRRYQGCPRQVALDKLLKEKMQNEGMTGGIGMHEVAERYVGKQTKTARVPVELKLVEDHAKTLRADPTTQVEMQLAFTRNWGGAEWFGKDAWVRIKVDARRILEQTKRLIKVVEITDWKSGRPNPFFDQHQAELYALGEFKYSGCSEVRTKFAHTDTGDETDGVFDKGETASLQRQWDTRTKKMLNDERFTPTPGRQCSWCPHRKKDKIDQRTGEGGNGVCGVG